MAKILLLLLIAFSCQPFVFATIELYDDITTAVKGFLQSGIMFMNDAVNGGPPGLPMRRIGYSSNFDETEPHQFVKPIRSDVSDLEYRADLKSLKDSNSDLIQKMLKLLADFLSSAQLLISKVIKMLAVVLT